MSLNASPSQFDSRYSVLSTLLCLANSPVNAPYQVEDRASPVAIAGEAGWVVLDQREAACMYVMEVLCCLPCDSVCSPIVAPLCLYVCVLLL